jgi:hypothetical protein
MTDPHTLETARQLFVQYGDAAGLLIDPRWLLPQRAGPAIYICDVNSGRVLVLPTAAGALLNLSEQADVSEADYLNIRTALQVLLQDLLDATGNIHPDTRRGVIFGAAFCTTETRGFHITRHHGSDVQYLLLRYPDAATGEHVLTPMPMFKAHPISATDLEATATHVLLSEHLNFPERFSGGKPLRFAEERRNVLAGKG